MPDNGDNPRRITPFYETPEAGQQILLFEDDSATLKQGKHEITGKVAITQQWLPMGLYWDFYGANFAEFEFGEVSITTQQFMAKGRLFSLGARRVAGYVEGAVEIGGDHKLSRVTFHLPNYPDLMGQRVNSGSETTGATSSWSQIELAADPWRIVVQPYRDVGKLRINSRENRSPVLCGVGEIRKMDGTVFKKKAVLPVLEALRVFLSFCFAEWSPPVLAVGSSESQERSWQMWRNFDCSPTPYLSGWADHNNGDDLASAFPGFMKLWGDEEWQEPLELAVTWLIEASRRSSGLKGAIALSQIPLEMIAWMVFVEHNNIVDTKDFKPVSAAGKLQLLLTHCRIPLEVPAGLPSIHTIAGKNNGMCAARIATEIRNTIIHPHRSNRKMLDEWETKYGLDKGDLLWETHRLFTWYITLVILSLYRILWQLRQSADATQNR